MKFIYSHHFKILQSIIQEALIFTKVIYFILANSRIYYLRSKYKGLYTQIRHSRHLLLRQIKIIYTLLASLLSLLLRHMIFYKRDELLPGSIVSI